VARGIPEEAAYLECGGLPPLSFVPVLPENFALAPSSVVALRVEKSGGEPPHSKVMLAMAAVLGYA
jgi:hypothetical protein